MRQTDGEPCSQHHGPENNDGERDRQPAAQACPPPVPSPATAVGAVWAVMAVRSEAPRRATAVRGVPRSHVPRIPATTACSPDSVAAGSTEQATFVCTVTDSGGNSAETNEVTATASNIAMSGGGPLP